MSFNYELIRNIDWFKYMSLSDAGTKIIVGFTVVFIGLVLLVTIFSIMGLIFKSVSKSSAKKEEKKKAKTDKKSSEKKTVVAEKKEALVSAPVPVVEDGISDEVVAVIAAAVAAMYEGSDVKPVIRRIKKSGGNVRPAWTAAGIFENTRSF